MPLGHPARLSKPFFFAFILAFPWLCSCLCRRRVFSFRECDFTRGCSPRLRFFLAPSTCYSFTVAVHTVRTARARPCTRFARRAPNRDRAHGSHGAVWTQGCAFGLLSNRAHTTIRKKGSIRRVRARGSHGPTIVHTVRTVVVERATLFLQMMLHGDWMIVAVARGLRHRRPGAP